MDKCLDRVVGRYRRKLKETQLGISTHLVHKDHKGNQNKKSKTDYKSHITMKIIIPSAERSGDGEGKTGGRARLFLSAGWEFRGVVATNGSNSHGDTLSGRNIEEGSSHWT